MWLDFFPYPLLAGLAVLVPLLALLWRRGAGLAYLACFSIFWCYLLALVAMVLFPIPIPAADSGTHWTFLDQLSRANWIPFYFGRYAQVNPSYLFVREIVANVALTLPFGFGLPFIARGKAKNIVWIALAVGAGIELSQFLLCLALDMQYRTTDVNDALTNAAGVLLGYACFRVFARLLLAVAGHGRVPRTGFFGYVFSVASRSQPDEVEKVGTI